MPDIYLHAITSVCGSVVEENDSASLPLTKEECERLVSKVGVERRPLAAAHETTASLACDATSKLLREQDLSCSEISALVVCTQTPDHLIPGVSSRVHGELSLPTDCLVMDINQGCSGFILGTQTMAGLLQSGAAGEKAILVNADTYSRLIRPDDLTTRTLFGDAATASLFSTRPAGLKLLYSKSFADGKGYESFVARSSALKQEDACGIFMDGPAILTFALKVVPAAMQRAFQDLRLSSDDISKVLFHQANSFVIGKLMRKLSLSKEKVPQNCANYGNTVSASIPLLLSEIWTDLKPGDKVMTVGFGVGLSWGVTVFEAL